MPRAIGTEAVTPARDLGAGAFRLTLQWAPGQTRVSDSDVEDFQDAVRDTAGMKVVLAVYSFGPNAQDAPKTGTAAPSTARTSETRSPVFRRSATS